MIGMSIILAKINVNVGQNDQHSDHSKVSLKCLNNSQSNEDETYSIKVNEYDDIFKIYGISQNPDTKNYIIVLNNSYCKECGEIYTNVWGKWCKPCGINNLKQNFTNWTSGNKKIDEFIQEMQLLIESYNDIIVEWIPYNQFNNVKKIGKDGFDIAIWKNGSLKYNYEKLKYEREPNKEVTLKCLNNSQNVISNLLNEAKVYSYYEYNIPKIYGISQNPGTKNYIIVLNNSYCKECGEIYTNVCGKWCKPCRINNLNQNFTNCWTSGNEKIDEFIQEMQLKFEIYDDIIVEWIPYNQFNNVKKIGKDGFATAIWKNGSLKYNYEEIKYERKPNKEVTLKCLNNSQNVISGLLNEAKAYS
ncbi:kinase-like domain-containing protein [Rhizophagus irregularis DAOM 181602=DAOM 197198]|nr:kinase-like domain-containing protein [Rhizophagus irregularis DAOM 181602=DAOM 197198]